MGSYVIRVKVLPSDASVDIEKVVDSVKKNLGSEAQLRGKSVEPIAFGISAVVLDIVAPEKEGSIEAVETSPQGRGAWLDKPHKLAGGRPLLP
ncbi:MAG: elongation factor 1-beta [Thaumarchaeota archaeon]|nr:MAG: elongation factor 1-beta [Nitrososphaerota archaeon]